jgi:chromate reductase, NAD(P)H dehydrogenase (quinone)
VRQPSLQEGFIVATSVLGISGSLRAGSFNTATLRAAQALAPDGMTIEMADISAFPVYNEDVYQKGFPPPVETLREQIRRADAVLLVTPEYNYSVAAPMKNAIDWVSRPPLPQPFDSKPVAIMGASGGRLGTARAQYHLRQVMVFLNAHVLNKPEVMIGPAGSAFDKEGNLTDEATRNIIRQQLEALAAWAQKLS